MKPKITESDLCRAAKRLRTSTAEVETVAEVESAGNAFYSDGFPVILFERHKFRKFTDGQFDKSHPHLSNRISGGYSPPKGIKNEDWQRAKFTEAFGLNPEAAMKSCSWGKFQIMGFNYEVCGFNSVGEFVDAMKESEGRQLDAFVEFVIHSGLADELRSHRWEDFARAYNGPDYKKNRYHIKLPTAFAKFSKRKIHCGPSSASVQQESALTTPPHAPPSGETSDQQAPTETKVTESVETGDTTVTASVTTPAGDPPDAPPTKVSTNGALAKWLTGGGLAMVGTFAWNYIQSNPSAVGIVAICITLLIVALVFRGAITDAIRMQTAADPTKKNVS
jgi:hypothetical protein